MDGWMENRGIKSGRERGWKGADDKGRGRTAIEHKVLEEKRERRMGRGRRRANVEALHLNMTEGVVGGSGDSLIKFYMYFIFIINSYW